MYELGKALGFIVAQHSGVINFPQVPCEVVELVGISAGDGRF